MREGLRVTIPFLAQLREEKASLCGQLEEASGFYFELELPLLILQIIIARSLGQLEGWGALSGLQSEQLPLWQVAACIGGLITQVQFPELAADVQYLIVPNRWELCWESREVVIQEMQNRFGYKQSEVKELFKSDAYIIKTDFLALDLYVKKKVVIATKAYDDVTIREWEQFVGN